MPTAIYQIDLEGVGTVPLEVVLWDDECPEIAGKIRALKGKFDLNPVGIDYKDDALMFGVQIISTGSDGMFRGLIYNELNEHFGRSHTYTIEESIAIIKADWRDYTAVLRYLNGKVK